MSDRRSAGVSEDETGSNRVSSIGEARRESGRGIAIVGFVLSVSLILNVPGLVLSIIAMRPT